MNEYYLGLQKVVSSELEKFIKFLNSQEYKTKPTIVTVDITLKNGLVIYISKWLTVDFFVKFRHVNDLSFYTLEELIEMNYIPESFQKSEFLEIHSTVYAYGMDVK